MSRLDKVDAALEALIQDRYRNPDMVTAVIQGETAGVVKLFYPASFREDKIHQAISKVIPASNCHEWSKAGGFIDELNRYVTGHTTVLTVIADDAQLEQIASALDQLREERGMSPTGSTPHARIASSRNNGVKER